MKKAILTLFVALSTTLFSQEPPKFLEGFKYTKETGVTPSLEEFEFFEVGDKEQFKALKRVANKLGEPAMRDFAGEVASKMYAVYIEDAPATTVDISTFATGTIDAIRGVDPSVPKDEDPKMDPIDVKKNEGDTDIKGIRNLAKSGVWLFLALGVLLQVAAWFLATAGQWKKLQRLGIRLAIGGVIMFATISVVKSKVPQSVEDNEAAAKAAANFITSPMLTRFIVLTVLGIVITGAGFFLQRKENASPVS